MSEVTIKKDEYFRTVADSAANAIALIFQANGYTWDDYVPSYRDIREHILVKIKEVVRTGETKSDKRIRVAYLNGQIEIGLLVVHSRLD